MIHNILFIGVIFIKFLIIGSTGLLGQNLVNILSKSNIDVVGIARKNADYNLDISNDKDIIACLKKESPDVVINTVAIVNIDFCQTHPGIAYLINSRPVSILADYCNKNNIYFIQISTDHYFTGDNNKKHSEKDKIYLLNEYSKTKFLGEVFTLQYPNFLIIRTNIVGFRGWADFTFIEWVIDSLKKKKNIDMFYDYYTSSIDTLTFSKILIDLIYKKASGIFNIGSRDVSSKKDFILEIGNEFGFSTSNCSPKSIHESLINNRGESIGLDVSKAEKFLGYNLPSMKEVIKSLKDEYKNRKRL